MIYEDKPLAQLREPTPTVTIVVTTYNDADDLRDALASIFAQHLPPQEVYVVDDGSTVSPASIVSEFPTARLIRKANGGLASARNAGLSMATTEYILFLDADDRLRPDALSADLTAFKTFPEAGMVYGAHIRIAANGEPISGTIYQPVSRDPYADLLAGNQIGMHATVLYRTAVLSKLGGFEESLRRCEDYELYLRLAKAFPVASHPGVVAEYRWHGANMSRNTNLMLNSVLAIHDRHHDQTGTRLAAWKQGRINWTSWYKDGQQKHWDRKEPRGIWRAPRRVVGSLGRRFKSLLRRPLARIRGTWPPQRGAVRFGDLGSTKPVSLDFGWDRGTPIDRYYIESFLAQYATDIAGRVLEVGDDVYSQQFGGAHITQQDVLHLNADNPRTTIVGDLAQAGVLSANTFDCIVLTQTLQLIFDLPSAIRQLHAALKTNGVLLLTVPGITQLDRQEWSQHWCWSFTASSVRKLLEPCFGSSYSIETHGNVFAATAFLQGVALEEVPSQKLDVNDPAYPVIITARTEKL